jgi:hypothetical protein
MHSIPYICGMPISQPIFNIETGQQVNPPAVIPDVKLDKRLKDELFAEMREEGMVIVHCSFFANYETGIRIWNSTFLVDEQSGIRSPMHHAENITIAPEWMLVPEGSTARFTLIFAPLPKTCKLFDLLEDIPESGGFFIHNIKRNRSDVYHVKIG